MTVSCGGTGADDEFRLGVCMPRYAGGFEIVGAEGRQSTILRTLNPWQGAEGVATELFIARNGEKAPEGFRGEVLNGEARRIVCLSSTHIAMLDATGGVDRIVGVSGKNYVSNDYIAKNVEKIGDIGYEGNIDYELLVSLSPDIVLLYGVSGASGMEGKLRELGIPFAYIGDYLEDSPLGKAEWMVAVAEIAGCRERAEAVFAEIPLRYNELKEAVSAAGLPQPKVMLNTPYGDSWFMAPVSGYLARLIADAGGDYLYKKNTSNRSLPVDIEEAAVLVSEADVWLHVGDIRTVGELKRRLPKFADAGCVSRGDIWNCDLKSTPSGGNDYWESSAIHPDLVLRDLIKIFHPGLVTDDEPFAYYRRLK